MAYGARLALSRRGIRVPQDVSLIGFDDLTLAGLHRIAMTTVGQPRMDLGRQAVGLVLERLDESRTEARHVIIPPNLVIRSTTGPAPDQPLANALEDEQ